MNALRQPKREQRIVIARHLRREATEPERKLWRALRALPVDDSHFRRQAPIGPYYADFVCHNNRLVIELDGETHTSSAAREKDDARSLYFQSKGYRVLRFWNGDVMKNLEGVMTIIQQSATDSAAQAPPPLTPPRASRGRGK
jgi:very-short-patch-repair endonuclease